MAEKRKLNESITTRFVSDLLMNLSLKNKLNLNANLGAGLLLSDIVSNIALYDNPLYFSGVYIQCQPSGQILVKAMKAKSRSNVRVLSKTYCIKKNGIEKAFKHAVKQRAIYCDFKGILPLDELTVPTSNEIYNHIVDKKDIAIDIEPTKNTSENFNSDGNLDKK